MCRAVVHPHMLHDRAVDYRRRRLHDHVQPPHNDVSSLLSEVSLYILLHLISVQPDPLLQHAQFEDVEVDLTTINEPSCGHFSA